MLFTTESGYCNGNSTIPSGNPSTFNSTISIPSIEWTQGINDNGNGEFGGSQIRILLLTEMNPSMTLIRVKYTDSTGTNEYQSTCQFDDIFNSTHNIIFRTYVMFNLHFFWMFFSENVPSIIRVFAFEQKKITEHQRWMTIIIDFQI